MNSGIYTITNKIDGKMYIGLTTNFIKRKSEHFKKLRENRHHCTHLQNAVNKYKIENFVFEILEEYPPVDSILLSMEHYWANLLNVHDRKYGYNIQLTTPMGKVKVSEETKRKLSQIQKGKKLSEEQKKKMSERSKIIGISDKCREACIKANTGAKRSEECRKRMSDAHKGEKQTKERIKNQQESRKNNGKSWHSEETVEKIRKAHLGKKAKPGAHQKGWETRRRKLEEKKGLIQ